MQRLLSFARSHEHVIRQFFRYLVSGGSAAALELISFRVFLFLGVWYLIATPLSSGIGILSAFLLHKYFVFQKKQNTRTHAVRYAILTVWNILAQIVLVLLFVEVFGATPMIAKILGIGCVVSWNFILYRLLVYV